LFTSDGTVITATTFTTGTSGTSGIFDISLPHFGHTMCSFGECQNYLGVCFANSTGSTS
jgi:hypothetical protein